MNPSLIFWSDPNKESHLRKIKSDISFRMHTTIKNRNKICPKQVSITCHPKKKQESKWFENHTSNAKNENKNNYISSTYLATPLHCFQYGNIIELCEFDSEEISNIKNLNQFIYEILSNKVPNNKQSLEPEIFHRVIESLKTSFELGSTMALVCKTIGKYEKSHYALLPEKAFLIGLYSEIGTYLLIDTLKKFIFQKNYIHKDILLHIFNDLSQVATAKLFSAYHFDTDFKTFAQLNAPSLSDDDLSYHRIANIALYLLHYRKNLPYDDEIELTLSGAEAMFELSNLNDHEFQSACKQIIPPISPLM